MEKEIEIIPLYFDYVLDRIYPVVILVGGRNSGKSFFMEQLAVVNTHNKYNYKMLVIEDVETNIGEGVKDGIEQRAEDFGYHTLYSSTKQPAEITHKHTGSNVIFKGYHSEKQQKQVKSLNEVTAAWYEEAENITYKQFKALRMQLRGGNKEDRQLFLTLNPINESSFINAYFFQGKPDKVYEYFDDGRPKVFEKNIVVDFEYLGEIKKTIIPCIIIVSTHHDNPYLTMEQRADIEEMKETDPDMYAMLAEGKFIKPAGTFFKEFNYGIHVVEPFVIPDNWTRYRALDYGLDMLACLWFAVSPDGRVYCYKELHESNLIISEAAQRILEVNGNDQIYYTYAPSDLNSRSKDSGVKISETFANNGVDFYDTSNKRAQGALAIKEALKVEETRNIFTGEIEKVSNLCIFDNCVNLIKYLPMVLRDEADANCYATEPHERTHIVDALRYYCVTRYNGYEEEVVEVYTENDRYENDMGNWSSY